jgi:hypothetical protein
MIPAEPKPLTIGQTATRFRVPVVWLREEAEAGRIPHLKAGKVFLFDPQAVERELLRRGQQSKPREVSAQ